MQPRPRYNKTTQAKETLKQKNNRQQINTTIIKERSSNEEHAISSGILMRTYYI